MKDRRSKGELVLAVYPSTKGFGFAVFEDSRSLVDWGVKGIRGGKNKNAQSLRKVRELLAFYHPDALVVRSNAGESSPRASRIPKLIDVIIDVAEEERMVSKSFSRADVRARFSHFGARTKREIAESIVREFPELEPQLPPVRKIWMSEDARMSMFDAVALGMTFFHTKRRINRPA